MHNSINH